PSLTYKAIVELNAQVIARDGRRYALTPGMHVVAEIHQGSRTVLEYLLSPVRGVLHEAMRER
ncbi:MAG: HlyD family type I secretion periplasmic adaptor subunit, partial [Gammaproteobacteria bacterium]